MLIGLFTVMGGFCLVVFLPVFIGLYVSFVQDKRARDIAAYVGHNMSLISGGAQQDMDTLTAQFRSHVDEQTKQYRKSQAGDS
jgi:hypothetical protein